MTDIKENRVDLKTSTDFQSGYDAASKVKQLIMDAQQETLTSKNDQIDRLRAALEAIIVSDDPVTIALKALASERWRS